jgi:nitroimidazol reductase NimA-like FMN-containing flavoprotein (pyridoxamine 5'-phosphate oxidase superfamily)
VTVSPDDRPLLAQGEAELVAAARVSYLATIDGESGRPHVVPVSHVLDLDRIVFATDTVSKKVRNLRVEPRAAICVDEYAEDWSQLRQVIAWGEALLIEGGFEWERDRALLYEKFPQYPAEAPIEDGTTTIVEIRIDEVVSSGF